MANVAEKARFYLERSVPQLKSFEEKEIFTKDEIRTIVHKRTEHEHRVLGPSPKPSYFQSYIAWEHSLEALRAKRCKRLKIRKVSSNAHASQAKIFDIYERGVGRLPDSLALWKGYLEYAAKVKATKRWRKIVTRALRLHPMDSDLWAMAARRAARDGDMDNARSLFMRGCRFCNQTPDLWLDYAKVEMEWLTKMEPKKGKKQALEAAKAAATMDEGDVIRLDKHDDGDEFDEDQDMLVPDLLSQIEKPPNAGLKEDQLQKLAKSPALEGAIPKAIFDAARKQRFFTSDVGSDFFDLFASYHGVSTRFMLMQHVLDALVADFRHAAATLSCQIRQPVMGHDMNSVGWLDGLRGIPNRIKVSMETVDDRAVLVSRLVPWIDSVLRGIDQSSDYGALIQQVLLLQKVALQEVDSTIVS